MASIYRPTLTAEYSTNVALSLISNFDQDNYYLTIGKDDIWSATEGQPEFRPPQPIDNENYKHQFWDDVVGYIKVHKANVRLVLDRRDWGDSNVAYSKSYNINDITVTNSILDVNTSPDLIDGLIVYRCIQAPLTGSCVGGTGNNTNKDSCDLNGGAWHPSDGSTCPTGLGTGIDTGDGYIWEYLYTVPVDEVDQFCTPEYVVCPTPEELQDTARWGRELLNSTVFDVSRICYEVGASKIMVYTLLTDSYFQDMIIDGLSFRQIGLVLSPYTYEIAPDCNDLDGDPVYFANTPNGGCSILGWKIVAETANDPSYSADQILGETGELLYMENRAPVQRSKNELQEIRIILGF